MLVGCRAVPRLLVSVILAAGSALAASERAVEISAASSLASAVETFPDPFYVGENDYLSAPAGQMRLMGKLENVMPGFFQIAYQGLWIKGASEKRGRDTYAVTSRYTTFLQLATAIDSGVLRWHFGFAALLTFSDRSSYEQLTGKFVPEAAVNTRLSQAYPSVGLTLFPKAAVRFSAMFLNGDANLLYGWLRLQFEFDAGDHTFMPAFELLNHHSFGKGIPNFAEPPGAFSLGYSVVFGQLRLQTRAGFVLNSSQGFNNARVSFPDRIILEFGASYRFAL